MNHVLIALTLMIFACLAEQSWASTSCEVPLSFKCSENIYYQPRNANGNQIVQSCMEIQDLVEEAIHKAGFQSEPNIKFVFRPLLSGQYGGTFISAPLFDSQNRDERLNTLLHELGHFSFHQVILNSSLSSSRAQRISNVLNIYGEGVISFYESQFDRDEITSCSSLNRPSIESLNLPMGSEEEAASARFLVKYHELYADFFQCSISGDPDCRQTQTRSFASSYKVNGRLDNYNYFSPSRQILWNNCFYKNSSREALLERVSQALLNTMRYELNNPEADNTQINLQLRKEIEKSCQAD